jgi:hypothetical protein
VEPATIFSAARVFGAGAKRVHSTLTPDHGVSTTAREWSRTYSLFVPYAADVQQCSPPVPSDVVANTKSAARWIKRHRALPIGVGEFGLVIQAKAGTSVVIDDIQVRATIAKTVPGIALRQALGGPIVALSLEVDLDREQVRCIDSRQFPEENGIEPLFSVSTDEPLVLRVSGAASTKAVLWHLELSMIVNGRAAQRRVPDEQDWITIPYCYEGVSRAYEVSSNAWVPVPPKHAT